ncbi:MAG TPA: iron-containing redox enzyme family protein [Alphaproteobacteria bacterium]|nr:iron-containing redox enzyme family protein [Alphaproteobacteria bacterium]
MATKIVALKTKSKGKVRELEEKLVELANDQHRSEEFQRLFKARFTKKGAQKYFLQHSLFNLNRRDCWGFVQGAAPMAVKRMVWDHEQGELAGDKERNVADHYTLAVMQGKALGLTPKDFYDEEPMDTSYACFQGWINVARTSHWLEAAAASAILELTNSEEVVRTGCISRRIGEKLRDELGIPMRKQYSNAEHTVADVEHGKLVIDLARLYGDSAESRELILSGSRKSLAIERAFRGFTATILEKYAK